MIADRRSAIPLKHRTMKRKRNALEHAESSESRVLAARAGRSRLSSDVLERGARAAAHVRARAGGATRTGLNVSYGRGAGAETVSGGSGGYGC